MDNQVSKSAEQVADTQKLTIDRVIYLLNEWGYPEARRRFIELRSAMSSQTASAASAVAGVSADDSDGPCVDCGYSCEVWFATNEIWNAVIPDRVGLLCLRCFYQRAVKVFPAVAFKLETEVVAQPSAEQEETK